MRKATQKARFSRLDSASGATIIPATDLLSAVVGWLLSLLLSPAILGVLGLIGLIVGLPRARRVRRPGRFRAGIIALALAFMTFWPLQFIAARVEVGFAEYKMALHASVEPGCDTTNLPVSSCAKEARHGETDAPPTY